MKDEPLFQPGDEVGVAGYGGPFIISASGNKEFPLNVGNVDYFTPEGKQFESSKDPILYHWKMGHNVVVGERLLKFPLVVENIETGCIWEFTSEHTGRCLEPGIEHQTLDKVSNNLCNISSTIWKSCNRPIKFPIVMKNTNTGNIVEFSTSTSGTYLEVTPISGMRLGEFTEGLKPCSNEKDWTLCERPVWKPTKPTWCRVWDKDEEEQLTVLIYTYQDEKEDFPYRGDSLMDNNNFYTHAIPIPYDEIPAEAHWPEEWM